MNLKVLSLLLAQPSQGRVHFFSPFTASDTRLNGTQVLKLHLPFPLKVTHRLLQITPSYEKEMIGIYLSLEQSPQMQDVDCHIFWAFNHG